MASSRILNTTPNSIRQRSTLRLNASAERREERRARSTVDLVQWEQHDQHRLLVCAGEEEKGGVVMMRGGGSGGGDVSSRRQVWRMHSGGTSDDGGGQWETLRSLKLGQVRG